MYSEKELWATTSLVDACERSRSLSYIESRGPRHFESTCNSANLYSVLLSDLPFAPLELISDGRSGLEMVYSVCEKSFSVQNSAGVDPAV